MTEANGDNSLKSTVPAADVIPRLCKSFYSRGWVTGTGGGISIREGNQIYIAPSGVQKERLSISDLFIQDKEGKELKCPDAGKKLKKSQCTPLFMCIYRARNAGAVIHTHSKSAVLITLLWTEKEFRASHLEAIKGIKNQQTNQFHKFDDEIAVPIIENTCFECDLEKSLAGALEEYPKSMAVLVRRHGLYVWGATWQEAKAQCETYDYIFDINVQIKMSKCISAGV